MAHFTAMIVMKDTATEEVSAALQKAVKTQHIDITRQGRLMVLEFVDEDHIRFYSRIARAVKSDASFLPAIKKAVQICTKTQTDLYALIHN